MTGRGRPPGAATAATPDATGGRLGGALSDGALQGLSYASLAFYVVGFAISAVTKVFDPTVVQDWGPSHGFGQYLFVGMTALFPVVGVLIIRRQPRNVVGWMLHATGIAWGLTGWFDAFERFSIDIVPSVHGGEVAEVLSQVLWWPPIVMMGVYTILYFPDGRLPSPRWSWLPWLTGIDCALGMIAGVVVPGPVADVIEPLHRNPLALPISQDVGGAVFYSLFAILPVTLLAAVASVLVRFRRSTGVERVQIKWLLYAMVLIAGIIAVTIPASLANGDAGADPGWLVILQTIEILAFGLIPITIGIAITRHGLYEIDALISRTLLVGTLGVFITGVYVGVVVGIGALIGLQHPSVWLSVMATALVAVAFHPVREGLERVVNRLVYGTRATPYEVLSNFASSMAGRYTTGELLPRVAQTVSECLGGARVEVWLRRGDRLVREASWPAAGGSDVPVLPTGAEDISGLAADRVVPVRHRNEELGAIAVSRLAEPITPAEDAMLEHVASQAGLVLRNVRLVDDLQASRRRLVTSQDDQRRRLERDLHDGAQQSLVSVALMLRLAAGQKDRETLHASLTQAADQLQRAIAELRELARGIHPAILTERGLTPALTSLAERCPVPVRVDIGIRRRLPGPVEGTLYFVAAESLTNVAKYAGARLVTMRLEDHGDAVTLEVADDGVGGADASAGSGLIGLADRVAVVGGSLEVDSPPGLGTRVSCAVPLPRQAAVQGPAAFPLAESAPMSGAAIRTFMVADAASPRS